jgi:hypothetical protein
MNWRNASEENPGYSVYYTDSQIEGERYAVRKTRENSSGMWKLVHQEGTTEPFRIIYIGNTLAECKAYAQEHQELRCATT